MPVTNDLHFPDIPTSSMLSLIGLKDSFLKETIVLLRTTITFKIVYANVQWDTCVRVGVG